MSTDTDSYRASQAELAERCANRVSFALTLTGAGLAVAEVATMAASIIAAANKLATSIADVHMANVLGTRPLGIGRPDDDVPRLTDAVALVLHEERDSDPTPRLSRIARSEPVDAGRQALATSMTRNGITTFRWELDSPEACGLCRSLALHPWQGTRLPISHPQCQCTIAPIGVAQ